VDLIAFEFLAVHLIDSVLGLFLRRHFYKAEPSRFAGGAIPNDLDC
jgi:hypothetical protein